MTISKEKTISSLLAGIKELSQEKQKYLEKVASDNPDENLPLEDEFTKLADFTHEILTYLSEEIKELKEKK